MPYKPSTGTKRKQLNKRGHRSKYEIEQILTPLKASGLASDQMCSKKLKAALPEWLPHYEHENGSWMK